MNSATLAALGERVRAVLKALSEDKKEDSPVPAPPPDPDALPADPRVEGADASPKEKDLEAAGESQAAAAPAQPAPGEGEGAAEAGAPKPSEDGAVPDAGEEGEKTRPARKAFDEFGNVDLTPDEMRTLLKAYGVTPPTDEDKLTSGGVDVESILEAILQGLESQTTELSTLRKEVARLRSASAENERSIAKAIDSLSDPRTALAAPPRAITKAVVDAVTVAATETEAQFATRMFSEVQARRMTDVQARVEIRSFKSTPR